MASRPRLWIFLLLIASVVFGAPAFADEPRAIPGEVLIKYKQTARAADRNSLKERMGATSIKQWDFIGVEHLKLPEGKSVDEAIAEFATDPMIEYIEPNWEIKLDAIPNDPMFGQLWGMRNTGQFPGGIPGADVSEYDDAFFSFMLAVSASEAGGAASSVMGELKVTGFKFAPCGGEAGDRAPAPDQPADMPGSVPPSDPGGSGAPGCRGADMFDVLSGAFTLAP